MKMTDRPCSESSATLRWMSAFAPTSMPRVGSSSTMSSGAVASQRASSTFCWLPPERLRGGQVRVGRAHVESLHVLRDDGILLAAADGPHPAATCLDAEHDVLGDRQVADHALGAAVLR